MTWRLTHALARAVIVGLAGLVAAVAFGSPTAAVAALPLAVMAGLGLWRRPTSQPQLRGDLGRSLLSEGQGTVCRLRVRGADGVEHVTRALLPTPHVLSDPVGAVLSGPPEDVLAAEIGLTALRWGRRVAGVEVVALTTSWGGFRWGPVETGGRTVTVLPNPAPYDAAVGMPDPVGLVGAHRSRHQGDGSEYAATRPFAMGDRLRRINWRISARTGALHVDTSLTEEDSEILLVVDGLADHGVSGGITGAASSLDLGVRAAAAIAGQHLRQGDRVGLRILDDHGTSVPRGTGARHLRRILGALATVTATEAQVADEHPDLRVTAGTVVVVLTPLLATGLATVVASLARRGLPVLVVDTLPVGLVPAKAAETSEEVALLAWRMRLIEREAVATRLAALGIPVVPWRGPGTLDEVLRRLARAARLPRVMSR